MKGFSAIVSGSCSQATNAQVAEFLRSGGAARRIDPLELGDGGETRLAADIAALGRTRVGGGAGTAGARLQHGAAASGRRGAGARSARTTSARALERLLAGVAAALVERGARRLVVAGGETSGACVQALGVETLAHRPPDRSGRAVVPCRAGVGTDGLQLGAQVGQLRRASISSPARSRQAT